MNLRKAAEMVLEYLTCGPCAHYVRSQDMISTLREALAQPEQEPYAYTAEGECWSCRFTSKVDTEFRLKALNIPLEKLRYLYLHPAPIHEGWQLVPVEPTAAMLTSAGPMTNYDFHANGASPDADHVEWYKAMLAAAPKPEE